MLLDAASREDVAAAFFRAVGKAAGGLADEGGGDARQRLDTLGPEGSQAADKCRVSGSALLDVVDVDEALMHYDVGDAQDQCKVRAGHRLEVEAAAVAGEGCRGGAPGI